ncbi:uncharacterized protein LOC117105951 [Anneissia japonica]|uniref:uncharacterized protein LOC117105951 n=1 Tax=Anneissia japonica TaxID=1529436 RepID=UPI001425658B|nr:uncharacterized protein LOC117105951 [Anneissia japonica]
MGLQCWKLPRTKGCHLPPFSHFCQFIRKQAKVRNNPALTGQTHQVREHRVSTRKTITQPEHKAKCPIHNSNSHTLKECKKFKTGSAQEKYQQLKEFNLCFRCLDPSHRRRACKVLIKCEECSSTDHVNSMHSHQGGEQAAEEYTNRQHNITTACAQVCGDDTAMAGKSCAKIVPVVVSHKRDKTVTVRTYAIIDDQSNKSLVSEKLLDLFDVQYQETNYSLTSCNGIMQANGRYASGFVVSNLDGTDQLDLPPMTECNQLPEQDERCSITLLIGRDLIEAHHVLDQIIGPAGALYAQRLRLGWVIIGETCLGGSHMPNSIGTYRTSIIIQNNGKPSTLDPCPNQIKVEELFDKGEGFMSLSREEKQFVNIMEAEGKLSSNNMWTAPLTFRSPRPRLPNNREQAWKRAVILHKSLVKDCVKRQHFITFMKVVLDNGHAERAQPLNKDEECWYLPLFGVYHPKKRDKIRGVFDSSATFQGVSLNKVLLKGPDLTNELVGVLMRFRREGVAVCGDIENDGLTSCEDHETAISLVKRTQAALMDGGKIRLHKIASNSQEVLNAFDREEIAKDIRDFNVEVGGAPLQRSLGLQWRLCEDVFTFHID